MLHIKIIILIVMLWSCFFMCFFIIRFIRESYRFVVRIRLLLLLKF